MLLYGVFKVLYLVLSSTLLLALSFITHLQIITFMQMTLNTSHLFQLLLCLPILLLWKLQFQVYQTGCLLIFSLSVIPKLSFSSLIFLNNSLNSNLLLFVYQKLYLFHLLTLHGTLVSSLIDIFCAHTFLLFRHHAPSIFGISDAYET